MLSTSDAWLPVASFGTPRSGRGFGLAACPALGLLVTSDCSKNSLSVWRLGTHGGGRGSASASGPTLACTLGGKGSPPPMQFKFYDKNGLSGYLAFLAPLTTAGSGAPAPLLLITDHGHDAVHLVDVVNQRHAGYFVPPGSVAGPRGVAACNTATCALVAISTWKECRSGDHVVHIFAARGSGWNIMRVIGGGFGYPGPADGQLSVPMGLRFSADGSAVCVADRWNDRVSLFRVVDGAFVRHIGTGLSCPHDVEEVENNWVVACFASHTVEFVDDGGVKRSILEKAGGGSGSGDGEFCYPVALALVPGLGLVVQEYNDGRLQVFSTPDMVAMQRMSHIRVAWMAAAARAILHEDPHPGQ